MSDSWSQFEVSGNKAFIIKEKLKLLKDKLRVWNKEVFGVVDLNIDKEVNELNSLDSILIENWDELVVAKRKEVTSKFWKDIRIKESMLFQKSRARWIREGDVNSKYFHSLLRYRRKRSFLQLLDGRGRLMEDVSVVKSTIETHFQNSFVEHISNRPVLGGITFKQISDEGNLSLLEPFGEDEIKEGCLEL